MQLTPTKIRFYTPKEFTPGIQAALDCAGIEYEVREERLLDFYMIKRIKNDTV